MRKTYFYMAFLALAFGISGCGDITCKEGESFCSDEKIMKRCERGELTPSICSSGCNFDTGKCKGSTDSPQEPVECPDNPYKCKGQDVSQECLNGEWISYTCEDGCDTQTGKCKACIEGSFKCADNHNLYSCKDGHWGLEKYCANGCNTSTGKCNANNGGNDNSGGGNNGSAPECTSGSYKCVDDISYYCDYGWWGTYDYCANGCNTSTGKCNVVGDGMAAECTSGSYKCENDTSYYCNYGWWAVEEYCEYGCDNKNGNCVDLCEPGGTQYCKKTCNYLGTEGYYYANGKVNTVYCSNYDCTTENDKVECRSQNGSGGIPAEIPSSCVKNVSPAICTNNNSVAYFCGNDGTYYKGKTCPNYDCVVCPDGFGGCGIACQ